MMLAVPIKGLRFAYTPPAPRPQRRRVLATARPGHPALGERGHRAPCTAAWGTGLESDGRDHPVPGSSAARRRCRRSTGYLRPGPALFPRAQPGICHGRAAALPVPTQCAERGGDRVESTAPLWSSSSPAPRSLNPALARSRPPGELARWAGRCHGIAQVGLPSLDGQSGASSIPASSEEGST